MTKLDHVGIYVSDMARTKAFYGELFSWKTVSERTSGEAKLAFLDIGEGTMEIVQRPGSPGTPPGGNWSHVAVRVEDWANLVAKVEAKGIPVRKVTMPNGKHNAFFNDPDGHTVEAMEA